MVVNTGKVVQMMSSSSSSSSSSTDKSTGWLYKISGMRDGYFSGRCYVSSKAVAAKGWINSIFFT